MRSWWSEPQARRFLAWMMGRHYTEHPGGMRDDEGDEAVLRAEGPTLREGMTADR